MAFCAQLTEKCHCRVGGRSGRMPVLSILKKPSISCAKRSLEADLESPSLEEAFLAGPLGLSWV